MYLSAFYSGFREINSRIAELEISYFPFLSKVTNPSGLIRSQRHPDSIRKVFVSLNSRVGKGISAQAAHGTVLESLPSHGSCYSVMLIFLDASDKINQVRLAVLHDTYHTFWLYR